MQTYSQTIGAGNSVRMHTPGTFFRLLATLAAVDIRFFRAGAEVARAEGMEAGYAERFEEAFDAVEISTATEQAIKWAVRLGGSLSYDRMAGEVSILSLPNAANDYAKNLWFAPLAGSTAGVLLTPAANVAGAILMRAAFAANSPGAGVQNTVICAAAAAPVVSPDALPTTAIIVAGRDGYFRDEGNAVSTACGKCERDIYIPPGFGVYVLSNQSITGQAFLLARLL